MDLKHYEDVKFHKVTHVYDFANRFSDDQENGALSVRAENNSDGSRTFTLFEASA
jgi:hypothetical protein